MPQSPVNTSLHFPAPFLTLPCTHTCLQSPHHLSRVCTTHLMIVWSPDTNATEADQISCSPSSFITATDVDPNSCISCVPSSLVMAMGALSINSGGLLTPAPPWSPVLPAPPQPTLPFWLNSVTMGVRSCFSGGEGLL